MIAAGIRFALTMAAASFLAIRGQKDRAYSVFKRPNKSHLAALLKNKQVLQ
jgi:hypothetical protein